MLTSFYVSVGIGTVLGFLSGLGVGGGSLLILWLTIVLDMPHSEARSINLLFFLPAALIACLFRWKQGRVEWKQIWPSIFAGCAAAAIFSYVGRSMDLQHLKKLFGVILIATGIREIFYKIKTRAKS